MVWLTVANPLVEYSTVLLQHQKAKHFRCPVRSILQSSLSGLEGPAQAELLVVSKLTYFERVGISSIVLGG